MTMKIRHVRKLTDGGCAVACCAMLAGSGFWAAAAELGEGPTEWEKTLQWVRHRFSGKFWNSRFRCNIPDNYIEQGANANLISVFSAGRKQGHMVLIASGLLFDPNEGRPLPFVGLNMPIRSIIIVDKPK